MTRLSILLPPSGSGSLGNLFAPLATERFRPRLAATPTKRFGCRVLSIIGGEVVLFLAAGDPHHLDGVADHVGGALLDFGSAWHRSLISFRQHCALRQSRPRRL